MEYTIGKMAKKFRLSRSTLLYYDSIGLLPISRRSSANYRVYGEEDCQRLEQICRYREAGISLDGMKTLLAGERNTTVSLMEERIHEISEEIFRLQEKQKSLVRLLLNYHAGVREAGGRKPDWKGIFQTAGFHDYDKWQWHHEFEVSDPEGHQLFLVSVEMSPAEIQETREWARRPYQWSEDQDRA